jgi:hypothetical protein
MFEHQTKERVTAFKKGRQNRRQFETFAVSWATQQLERTKDFKAKFILHFYFNNKSSL